MDNKGFEAAYFLGHKTEKGIYGEATTGVYSWADLTANFNGMRFWRNLTHEDPFTYAKPYFSCENGKVFWNKQFDLGDYLDAGWDERINQNSYYSEEMEDAVTPYIYEIPSFHRECDLISLKYSRWNVKVVGPKCNI